MNLLNHLIDSLDSPEAAIYKFRKTFDESKFIKSTSNSQLKQMNDFIAEYHRAVGDEYDHYNPADAHAWRYKIYYKLSRIYDNIDLRDTFLAPVIKGLPNISENRKSLYLGKSDIDDFTKFAETIKGLSELAKQDNRLEFNRDKVRVAFVHQLLEATTKRGLSELIWNRSSSSIRYNILLTHPAGETHCATLRTFKQIQKNFIRAFYEGKNYVINGQIVYNADVRQLKITSTPLLDDEVANFCDLYSCKSDLDFVNSCRDVTNDFLQNEFNDSDKTIWSLVHPTIQEAVMHNITSGDYLSALRSAVILLNNTVKAEYSKSNPDKEEDGPPLMQKAFSPNKPVFVLGNILTKTGLDIQQGYKDLFAGAMSAIRNPIAHENKEVDEIECMEKLIFISHLLRVFEGRIVSNDGLTK